MEEGAANGLRYVYVAVLAIIFTLVVMAALFPQLGFVDQIVRALAGILNITYNQALGLFATPSFVIVLIFYWRSLQKED